MLTETQPVIETAQETGSTKANRETMRPLSILLVAFLFALVALLLYAPDQIEDLQKDFQAYQSRSLLPD